MVSVPLALVATFLVLQWWAWPPLIVITWWWADRSWRWTWLVAVEAGVLGTQWAYVGAVALGTWPGQRLLVGVLWIAFVLTLAAVSLTNRRRNGHRSTYAGY